MMKDQTTATGGPADDPRNSFAPAPSPVQSVVPSPASSTVQSAALPSDLPSASPSVPLSKLARELSSWKGGMMNAPMSPSALSSTTNLQQLSGQSLSSSPVPSGLPAGSQDGVSMSESQGLAGENPVSGGIRPSALSSSPSQQDGNPSAQPSKQAGVAHTVPNIPAEVSPMVIEGTAKGKSYPYTIEDLLQLVVDKDASDLHITTNYPAMLRIDGSLVPVGSEIVTDEIVNELVLPVLPESKQELLEVNREVDLAYSFKSLARFRINAFYSKGTVSAAFRLIPNKIRNIEELRLPPTYHQLTQLPQGLVLVTGPTGHGKSTTLAAIIQEINENYPKHIITIEDPIEYVYPKGRALVAQREMHEDTHSWEIALRSAMREDPNVILVGEMRDYETIAAAITLAETGHLVFATLHTNSAAQTIDRIIDVFPEHQQPQVRMQMSVILEAIISQRLIPVNSGGRRAVSEVLFATGAVRNLIREGKTHQVDNVIRTSLDVGMKTLEHSLVELVREGELSTDEAESVALHPEELVRLLRV